MGVLIKDMEMPKECHGCRWFYFQGTSCTEPKYYLDARCELIESGQDWYGKDSRGGWVGESIEHIPGYGDYYAHKHCVEYGTRASQCPLCELPSAQPEQKWMEITPDTPEENVPVLLGIRFRDDFKYFVSMRQDYTYWTGIGRDFHGEAKWMPLPQSWAERREE